MGVARYPEVPTSGQEWAIPGPLRTTLLIRLVTIAFHAALGNLHSDRNLRARNENRLSHLVQRKSATAYAAEFQALIDPLELNNSAKCPLFHKGLKPGVKDAIANVGPASSFILLLDQAIRFD